jgi:hypothetical protein
MKAPSIRLKVGALGETAKEMVEAAQAFEENLGRVFMLSMMPEFLFARGAEYELAFVAAWMKVTGKPGRDRTKDVSIDESPVPGEVATAAQVFLRGGEMPPFVTIPAFDDRETWVEIRKWIAPYLKTLMQSQLVAAWTAFETLAGDLWVAAVNLQPMYLASLTGTRSRIEKQLHGKPKEKSKSTDATKPAAQGNDAPEMDANTLCDTISDQIVTLGLMSKVTQGKFNLGDKMGTLLREAKRVEFVTLTSIREAYSRAFSERAGRRVRQERVKNIDNALARKELDALSAVRNLIVHKAGIADDQYEKQAWCLPSALRLGPKQSLRLDGEILRTLLESVMHACVELIGAVDSWLEVALHES